MTLDSQLESSGWAASPVDLPENDLQALRDSIFVTQGPGQRCLLDQPIVQEIAGALRARLIQFGILTENAVAIHAIAFDKTPETNWKVAWHQDLMFPFERKVSSEHFDLPTIKGGIHYARPPESVLNQMLAVRLHLDDCDATNGPLRVSPGTHCHGILKTSEITSHVADHGEYTCLANKGEAILMRPLALHASSQATESKHRRVLHFVYHAGDPTPEPWHRKI